MDCFAGASTGALKAISLRDNSFSNLCSINELEPKRDEITAMAWNDSEQSELLIAQLNHQLKLYNTRDNTTSRMFVAEGGQGAIKGVCRTDGGEHVMTCAETGELRVWNDDGEVIAEWNVGPGVSAMRKSSEKEEVATGGIKNLVKTWDVETGKQTWMAKNVPPDSLQLEVPIMCTDVRFVDGQNTIIEATRHHEMRLYDPRAQRRPVKKIKFMENPITATSLCYKTNHVLAANSIGEMGLFDLRSKIHPVCKYKGQAGSIRSIDAHAFAPLVVTCGIDRFVRVHDLNSRKLVHKIYCKTRLNRVLMRKELSILNSGVKKEESDEEWEQLNENDDDDVESDDESRESDESDDVWQGLSEVTESAKNAKRKLLQQSTSEVPSKVKKEAPRRKRKESEMTDDNEVIIDEEPRKKSKVSRGKKRKEADVDIKEEPLSGDEETPLPKPKRKKVSKAKV